MRIKNFFIITIIFWVIAISFYFIGGEELKSKAYQNNIEMGDKPIGELIKGDVIEEEFLIPCDIINSISFYTATYDRANTGNIKIQVLDFNKKVISQKIVDVQNIPNDALYIYSFDKPYIKQKSEKLILRIESIDGENGNAITCWYSSNIVNNSTLTYNGTSLSGTLNVSVIGRHVFSYATYYWYIALFLYLLIIAYIIYVIYQSKHNKKSSIYNILSEGKKYKFLIKQLVSREFKTRYKRSYLGMFWSVLNPLITMSIQYIIFSTVFKSNVPNYPVYLLSGIILFSFFSEAVSSSLQSIINNASLITKVYVPKYIYPLTKVYAAIINLLFAFIPLSIIIVITSTKITKAYLLLPFGIICLAAFSIGVGLLLASAMVFFRDTFFLWGIVSMLWMYSTPIFYPVTIIPDRFLFFIKLNPLYHFIGFIREIIIQGISPEPMEYIVCIVFASTSLIIGGLVFKKTQNKFVLYI